MYVRQNLFDSGEWVDMSALPHRPDGLGWAWLIPAISAVSTAYGAYSGKRQMDKQAALDKKLATAQLQALKDQTLAVQNQVTTPSPLSTPALNQIAPVLMIGALVGLPLLLLAVKK